MDLPANPVSSSCQPWHSNAPDTKLGKTGNACVCETEYVYVLHVCVLGPERERVIKTLQQLKSPFLLSQLS